MKDLGAKPVVASRDTGSEDSGVDLTVVAGSIKWFDVAKGYGFIVPDDGQPDILLHVTCLRRDGFRTAYEGARIVCEVTPGARGLQAFRVLSMDESTAVHPSQLPPSRTHVQVTPEGGYEPAVVKWFNRVKGFGFLTRARARKTSSCTWRRCGASASPSCAPARP